MPYPPQNTGISLNPGREITWDISKNDVYFNVFNAVYKPISRGAKADTNLIPQVEVTFPSRVDEPIPTSITDPSYYNYIELQWTPVLKGDYKAGGALIANPPDSSDNSYDAFKWVRVKLIQTPTYSGQITEDVQDLAAFVFIDPVKNPADKEQDITVAGWYSRNAYRARVVCIKEWNVSQSETNALLVAEKDTAKGAIVAATPWHYPNELQSVDRANSLLAYSSVNPSSGTPAQEENAEEYTPPPQTMKMNLMRSNLPIAQKSVGSSQSPPPFGNVKWRSGFIHTWEGNPADYSFPDGAPYGFRFHYNPAGWSQNVQMTETINPDAIMASQPDFLPLYTGFATISLELFLNRIVDLSTARDVLPQGLDAVERRAEKLVNTLYQNVGVSSFYGVPGFVADSALNSSVTGKNSANAVSQDKVKLEHAKRILRQGTLYDLDFLYATVNGKALDSYHNRLAGTSNPSYNEDWKASDYGFLNARYVRIWLGPNITFVGRLTSVSVAHLMFTQYMIPTFSQVTIQIARSATFGNSPENSKELFNKNVVGTVDPGAEGNDTTGETTE